MKSLHKIKTIKYYTNDMFYFQSVTDMFHAILSEIERSDGHIQAKNGCVVS